MVAGTASAVVGGDVNTAANAAQIAVENNTLYPKMRWCKV
nr:VENN motif pre-toxin domain-containing protein [Neisseria meningitidis]